MRVLTGLPRFIIVGLLCALGPCLGLMAQRYVVEVLTPDQGLASNQTYQVMQDRRGFMWFGCTGGLSRFDGSEFRNFTVSDGLLHSSVRCMAEDYDGHLWLGVVNGLNVMFRPDARSDTVERLRIATLHTFRSLINDLLVDSEGQLWIATNDRGLYRIDPRHALDSAAMVATMWSFNEQNGLTRDGIRYLCETPGTIWIASENGLYALDRTTRHIRRFSTSDGLLSDMVVSLCADPRGTLWVGTTRGVNFVSIASKTLLPQTMTDRTGLPGNYVYHIMADRDGHIWLATKEGVVRAEAPNAVLLTMTSRHGLSESTVRFVAQDREGQMWFATDGGGINHLVTEQFTNYGIEEGLPGKLILALEEDHRRRLWIGTSKGLVRMDGQTFKTYTTRDGLVDNSVWVTHEATDGRLWIGTEAGISRLDAATMRFTNYSYRDGLSKGRFQDIIEDAEGFIWFASTLGISILDSKSGRFSNYGIDNGLPSNYVRSLFMDRNRTVWIGTRGGGLGRVNRRSSDSIDVTLYDTNHGFPNNTIGQIREDAQGMLWIATHAGVVQFDPASARVLRHLTVKDGLSHDHTSVTFHDGKGRLWVCGDRGIDVAEIAGASVSVIRHYDKSVSMIGEEVSTNNSVLVDHRGVYWFGFIGGLTRFDPADGTVGVPPLVYLRGISIRDQQEHDPYRDFIDSSASHLDLVHYQNTVTFYYSGLSFRHPHRTVYRYRLDGFDDHWSVPTPRRDIRYTNLPPGSYTFEVLAANSEGVWSLTPAAISVSIKPPYWNTWWFRGLAVIWVVFSAYNLYRYRLRAVQYRNRELERRIMERTTELEEKNEQLRELHALKDEFLNIAAHDLRNPLNSIMSTSRLILDEVRASRYRTQEYLLEDADLIHRASEHMLELINNLLDIAKIEAGKVQLVCEPQDMSALLREQIEEMRWMARKKDIRIDFQPGSSRCVAFVDREKIWQIMNNLLSNALKFTDHGGTVRVMLDRTDHEIMVVVADTGRGIAKENLTEVFNKFSNLSRVGTDGERGTGLGLAITRKLVELHGGRVWVESVEGQGARFQFNLPVGTTASPQPTESQP